MGKLSNFPFGFSAGPRFASALDVSLPARVLLWCYEDFASVSQGYVCNVTDDLASRLTGMSSRYVRKAKKELKDKTIISVKRGARGQSATITLNWEAVAEYAAAQALAAGVNLKSRLEPQFLSKTQTGSPVPLDRNQGSAKTGTRVPPNKSTEQECLTRDTSGDGSETAPGREKEKHPKYDVKAELNGFPVEYFAVPLKADLPDDMKAIEAYRAACVVLLWKVPETDANASMYGAARRRVKALLRKRMALEDLAARLKWQFTQGIEWHPNRPNTLLAMLSDARLDEAGNALTKRAEPIARARDRNRQAGWTEEDYVADLMARRKCTREAVEGLKGDMGANTFEELWSQMG